MKVRARRSIMVFLLAPAVVAGVAAIGGAGESSKVIHAFDTERPVTEPGRYPEAMVVKGADGFDGSFQSATDYLAGDGRFKVALWESGPGILRTDGYPHDEYCLVLEGELVVTNASGTSETFGPGDTFVIPKGWAGTWDMKTRFKKQYVAFGEVMPAR